MSNIVSITDLLAAIGSDNIKFQVLQNSLLDIKAKKGGSDVTFCTDAIKPADIFANTGPKGLIIWVDRDLMNQRLEEIKSGLHANISRAIVLESLVATFEREGSGTIEVDGKRYVSTDHLRDLAVAIRQLKTSGGAI
ncbi:hypothetical protein [Aeromonas salmonicida]|uniref:Uncharacterized protein n=2 Tax=Gammaproteobacteria TaxID=1236 RepID=A0A3L0VSP0_ECOLX|nr:hypothetical protein [Aeromonas salmonicida]QYH27409.1 hypothetical protein G9H43_18690 [Aeromonas salmonicida subsp. masoucida]QYH31698.1 hypothetical protein G9457_18810 [Aeromonas salmonicida subsp. masoucida]WGI38380.1 hypothetical protein QDU35_18910 [Aeromonas salmonicida]WHF36824.1 hypothetical protein QLQ87_00200 [Aeromonas salmonicida]HEH9411779.1 hypothetical protein [Aeromonas salmonicida]